MKIRYMIPLLGILAIFTACRENLPFPEVIEHYAEKKADSLKLRAARYLLKNLPYHYGVANRLVDSAGRHVTHLDAWAYDSDVAFRKMLDSMKYKFVRGEPLPDVQALTADYLIENIDLAFEAWKKPWARHLSFDEFCEYILPYRSQNEPLTSWRKYFYDHYMPLLEDSVKNTSSTLEVTKYMVRLLQQKVTYSTMLSYEDYPDPFEVERMRFCHCNTIAHYGLLAMRAVGIPVGMITMNWRFGNNSHTTNILWPNDTAAWYKFAIYDEFQQMGMPKDSMASYKTWRYTFAPNPMIMDIRSHSQEELPSFLFGNVLREDFTAIHCVTRDLTLEVPPGWEACHSLYLCRFVDWDWKPVVWGSVKDGKVTFHDATIRQMYRLGRYDNGQTTTTGEIFVLRGDGQVDVKTDAGPVESVDVVYLCDPQERVLKRHFTTYYWTRRHTWEPMSAEGVLWGFNAKTSEYREFSSSLDSTFVPVFYKVSYAEMPRNTVFYDDLIQRPRGIRDRLVPNDNNFIVY